MRAFLRVWLGISVIAIGLGIGLLIIAFASGARWEEAWGKQWGKDADFITMNDSYQGVEKLNVDISYGDVKIVKGNEFSISAENIFEGELESYVENGTWYVKEDSNEHSNFLGFSFPVRQLYLWNNHFAPKITLTLPENFVAGDILLNMDAGTVEADSVNATDGKFTVNAGTIEIDQLSISNESEYNVGTGKMVLKDVNVNDITVDCGVGSMEIDGVITGDNNIKNGVGNVDLKINGNSEDYNYDVTCGIGNVDIDGKSFNSINGKEIKNEAADNDLSLDCGIGNISVDFN